MKANRKFLSLTLALSVTFSSLLGASSVLAESKSEEFKLSKEFGTPEFIYGKLTDPSSKEAEEVVFDYIEKSKDKFKLGASAKGSFIVKSKEKDSKGLTLVRMQQTYKGVPVFGYTQKMIVDSEGVLVSVSGETVPELDKKEALKASPTVKAEEALTSAAADLGFTPEYEITPTSELVIYNSAYAYLVKLNFLTPEPGNWYYFVDASTGEIVDKFNTIKDVTGTNAISTGTGVLGDTKSFNTTLSSGTYYLQDNTRGSGIYTYNAANRSKIPGTLWYDSDGVFNSSVDAAMVDAHYNAGKTYDYYKNVFGRNSYNNAGAVIKSTAHYGKSYNNAFWNGTQMVYGDGDGYLFIPLSGALDVVAHELTHAVTESETGLIYENEPGALNESLSDIFGTLVECYNNVNPDWLMGEDIYSPTVAGDALRSLSNPAYYGDPDHYSKRYIGTSDYGGVHTNSGIINKAAYLLSEGGTHYGVSVSGIGEDKLGAILYRALVYYITSSETFSQFRSHMVRAASDLYGSSSSEVQSVNAAFDAVGIN